MSTDNNKIDISIDVPRSENNPDLSGAAVQLAVQNITGVTLHSDFFNPADAFSIVFADDGLTEELRNVILPGAEVDVVVNSHRLLTGYLDTMQLSVTVDGGTQVALTGRDVLGVMGDSVVPPNITGSASNSYHFKPEHVVFQILSTIVKPWGINNIGISDAVALQTVGVGPQIGVKVRGKTNKTRSNSLQKSLNRFLKPDISEGYLEYLRRVCKNYGLEVKMAPGSANTILFISPTYQRDTNADYYLYATDQGGNIKDATLSVDWRHQPAVLVGQCNTTGQTQTGPTLDRGAVKAIVFNEVTAFDYSKIAADSYPGGPDGTDIPSILSALYPDILAYVQSLTIGSNYNFVPLNLELIDYLRSNSWIIPFPYNKVRTVGRPSFQYDYNASTQDELAFSLAQQMSDFQTHYLTYHCTVQGFEDKPGLWMPNTMVYVRDELRRINGYLWVKERTFEQSTAHGSLTHLVLTMPYTYSVFCTDDDATIPIDPVTK